MIRTVAAAVCALLAATAATGQTAVPAKHGIIAVDTANRLLRFNAAEPQKLLDSRALSGLQAGERVLGIDFQVAKGQLFALGSSGRLYRVDTTSGALTVVGEVFEVALQGTRFGFDFNPTVNRIRVVGDGGQNLRLHPEKGVVVDADPKAGGLQTDGALAYDASDANASKTPRVVAAGYTYNKTDDSITTNFALDAALGALVTQGSREGTQPQVSPNSGRLFTVGALNAGAFEDASLDISDVDNAAYAALNAAGAKTSTWVRIDLATGAATRIGTVGGDAALVGIAIEP